MDLLTMQEIRREYGLTIGQIAKHLVPRGTVINYGAEPRDGYRRDEVEALVAELRGVDHADTKVCSRCHCRKPHSAFYLLDYYCKSCRRDYNNKRSRGTR